MNEDALQTEIIESGTVKIFYPLKGYGFISRVKGRDAFFHYQDIVEKGRESTVLEGDRVEFLLTKVDGKLRAKSVRKVG
jgi:CspA family cold shock protein